MWKIFKIASGSLFLFLICPQFLNGQVLHIKITKYPTPGSSTRDTFYYGKDRKLTWNDFTGNVRHVSPSAAVSFVGFSYDATSMQKRDSINIHIYICTYFVKPASWVRTGEQNSYALSHEQLHFDIAKLSEELFKDSVRSRTFSSNYYQIEIHFIYWHFWREMNKMQKKFDDETAHGTNKTKELVWEENIHHLLKEKNIQ